MSDFIKFFDEKRKTYPMHFNLYYSGIMDWCIRVWREFDESVEILNIQDCDVELLFAKAQVELKEWLLENDGGY